MSRGRSSLCDPFRRVKHRERLSYEYWKRVPVGATDEVSRPFLRARRVARDRFLPPRGRAEFYGRGDDALKPTSARSARLQRQ